MFYFSYIETPVKAPKTTQTTATLPSTHVTSVPAKAPSTRTVNSKTASPPTRRKDPLAVAKTPGKQTNVAGLPHWAHFDRQTLYVQGY